jgi:glucan phosphorylase
MERRLVDRRMNRNEALGGFGRFEALHLSFSSPNRLMGILRTVIGTQSLLMPSQFYLAADQKLCELYAYRDGWARKAILSVAGSGKFSSDRTIAQYAAEIWNAKPCPVP